MLQNLEIMPKYRSVAEKIRMKILLFSAFLKNSNYFRLVKIALPKMASTSVGVGYRKLPDSRHCVER